MIEDFGTSLAGEAVKAITLSAGDLTLRILTWGAALQSVRLAGVGHDLTLGADRMEDYLGALMYHGALVGPVVNRISGAAAMIAGAERRFEKNFLGRHCLHSGSTGTHWQNWRILSAGPSACVLGLDLPDGLGGFPGNRTIRAEFAVAAPASLTMTVSARTDAETIVNFANHSYWNLDGSPTWEGHSLRIAAEEWLPNDADFKPTGAISPVAGTPMDFRAALSVRPGAPELDNCFVLSRARVPLRDVLWLRGASGLGMTVATTEPGIQVYDQRAPARPGRVAFEGLAIEAQGWPDAPSHPHFPPITLLPGQDLTQVTQWRFGR